MSPQYITIHNTANDATALNEVAYMTRNTAATGYHVAIDDKYAVEAIPFSRNAWHAGDGQGDGNRKSIGIEICYSKSGGVKYAEAEANAIEYTAHLLKQYGWGIDRVKWHRDWSGKNCPHRILDEGRASAVRGAIARKLAELNAPAKPAAVVKPVSKPVEKPVVKPAPKPVAKPAEVVPSELNERQEETRRLAMELGITDGKNPLREVNQYYVWSAMIPLAERIKALEELLKERK